MPNIDAKKIDQNTIEFWRFNTENCDTSSVQIQRENLLSLLDLASKALATPNHLKDVKMEQLEIDGLCRRLEEHATDWNGAQMPDGEPAKGDPTAGTLRQAATLIRSLSSRVERAEREREDARVERGNIAEDYRELETKLRNTFADAQSMKRRAETAESEAAALRERVGVLEEAMNAIGRLAYTQGDRTFDDAMRVLSWIDDEYRRARTTKEAPNA